MLAQPPLSAAPELDAGIASRLVDIVAIARERGGASLRSIVLGGSLARGEALGVLDTTGLRLLSDLDLYFVAPTDDGGIVAAVAAYVAADPFFVVRPDLAVVPDAYFREASASMPTHQLAHAHRVLWGAPLDLHPERRGGQPVVDAEDAARLLFNRCVESLDPDLGTGLARLMHRTKEFIDAPMAWLGSVGEYTPDRWDQLERVRVRGRSWSSTSRDHFEAFLNHWSACLKARARGVVDRDELAALAAGSGDRWHDWTGGFALSLLEGGGTEALHDTLRDGLDAARLRASVQAWLRREPLPARLRRARRWCSIAPPEVTGWARHGPGGAGPDRILGAACLHYHGDEEWDLPLAGLTKGGVDGPDGLFRLWRSWIQGRGNDG